MPQVTRVLGRAQSPKQQRKASCSTAPWKGKMFREDQSGKGLRRQETAGGGGHCWSLCLSFPMCTWIQLCHCRVSGSTSPPACVSPLSCELNATNRGKEVTGRPQTEVCPAETVLGKWSHCALLRLHSCPTRRKWDTEMLSNTYSVTAHAW